MRSLALPLLLTALLLAVRLAAPSDLKSGDQGKSAQYVLHAWNTGEILVPREQGEILPTKPPLPTWVGLGFSAVAGGPSELAIRLPSAVAAFLLALLTGLLAMRLGLSAPVPAIAVMATAANYVFLKTATVVRPDMILALMVLGSIYAAVRALDGGGKGWAALTFLVLGLGVLSKGPVAVLVVATAIVPWALLRPDRPPLRRLAPLIGIPILVAVVAAWAVPAFLREGDALYRVMISGEIAKHTGGGRQPVYQYFLTFPGRFIPWVIFLPAGLALAWRERSLGRGWPLGLAFTWFAFGFVAMSLFGSKRADYLLPIVPAAGILVAAALARGGRFLGWLFLVVAGLLFLLLASLLVLGPDGIAGILPSHKPRLVVLARVIGDRAVLLAAALSTLTILAILGYREIRRGRPATAAAAFFALYLAGTATAFLGLPEVVAESTATARFAERVLETEERETPLLVYETGPHTNALLFRLGRAEPPADPAALRAALHRSPDGIRVATTEKSVEKLELEGYAVEVLIALPGARKTPAYRLLLLRPS